MRRGGLRRSWIPGGNRRPRWRRADALARSSLEGREMARFTLAMAMFVANLADRMKYRKEGEKFRD